MTKQNGTVTITERMYCNRDLNLHAVPSLLAYRIMGYSGFSLTRILAVFTPQNLVQDPLKVMGKGPN